MNQSVDQAKTKNGQPESVAIAPFVVPLIAYMLIGSFFPKFNSDIESSGAIETNAKAADSDKPTGPVRDAQHSTTVQSVSVDGNRELDANIKRYWQLTAVQFLAVGGSLYYWRKFYLQNFPFAVGWLSIVVGIVGAFLWIVLCHFQLEVGLFESIGLSGNWLGQRSGFNPFQSIQTPWQLVMFLVCRFGLLILLVPVAEELLLRGFLMRFVQRADFQNVRLQDLTLLPLIVGTLYGVLSHPSEAIAAAIWFSLVSWLMVRTGRFWDCVLAHTVTNGILGVYVITCGQWQLW